MSYTTATITTLSDSALVGHILNCAHYLRVLAAEHADTTHIRAQLSLAEQEQWARDTFAAGCRR